MTNIFRVLLADEGINQRCLKNWADVADEYALAVPKNLRLGLNFRPCCEGNFFTGRPQSVEKVLRLAVLFEL